MSPFLLFIPFLNFILLFLFVPFFPSGNVVLSFFVIVPSLLSQIRLPPPPPPHTHPLCITHMYASIFNMFQSPPCLLSFNYTDFQPPHLPASQSSPTKSTSPQPTLLPPAAFTQLSLFHRGFLLRWSEALLSPGWYDASGIMVSFAPFPACISPYLCVRSH